LTVSRLAGRRSLGAQAEQLAACLLEQRGLRILERNWRRPEGEVDLVAEHNGVLVFVEVRSRTGEAHGHPLETVNLRKQRRVIRAARRYLEECAICWSEIRFDVVGITFPEEGGAPIALHIEDAFRVS
jgi:putative endonuclease